ncbi:unnamed protein product, partial [Tetraodon nigroviridis]
VQKEDVLVSPKTGEPSLPEPGVGSGFDE